MLAVNLPNDIAQRVNQVANQTGCSANEFVREAVLDYLQQKEKATKDKAFEDFVAMVSSRELDPTFVAAVEALQKAPQQERDWSVFE